MRQRRPTQEDISVAEAKSALKQLLQEKALIFGDFTLSSGKTSKYYFDGKQVTLSPEGSYLVGRVVFEELNNSGAQAIGGPTLGADPIVAATSLVSHLEGRPLTAFIVRKEPKKHGKQLWIEGPLSPGSKVALIDDVVTTGESLLRAIRVVREEGCEVVKVLALLDRLEGATANLAKAGFTLAPIFTLRDFQL